MRLVACLFYNRNRRARFGGRRKSLKQFGVMNPSVVGETSSVFHVNQADSHVLTTHTLCSSQEIIVLVEKELM